MPILEAMAFNKPVLCSNVTSLPEVAGDAAILFDPRKPQEIAAAIEKVCGTNHADYIAELIEAGNKQQKKFADTESMAREYLKIFNTTLTQENPCKKTFLFGIENDGWISKQAHLTFSPENLPARS